MDDANVLDLCLRHDSRTCNEQSNDEHTDNPQIRLKRTNKMRTTQEKQCAIELFHRGISKAQISRYMNIPESTLRGWLKDQTQHIHYKHYTESTIESLDSFHSDADNNLVINLSNNFCDKNARIKNDALESEPPLKKKRINPTTHGQIGYHRGSCKENDKSDIDATLFQIGSMHSLPDYRLNHFATSKNILEKEHRSFNHIEKSSKYLESENEMRRLQSLPAFSFENISKPLHTEEKFKTVNSPKFQQLPEPCQLKSKPETPDLSPIYACDLKLPDSQADGIFNKNTKANTEIDNTQYFENGGQPITTPLNHFNKTGERYDETPVLNIYKRKRKSMASRRNSDSENINPCINDTPKHILFPVHPFRDLWTNDTPQSRKFSSRWFKKKINKFTGLHSNDQKIILSKRRQDKISLQTIDSNIKNHGLIYDKLQFLTNICNQQPEQITNRKLNSLNLNQNQENIPSIDEAIKHGEQFQIWLENCSSPLVSRSNIRDFKKLMNNVIASKSKNTIG